ncbi:hypothetical protein A5791_00400 [Mycobacterium sp. 852002-51163_SCH5372311]|nr:hypothetical protein A5791_00400 [Mycobacterium sp. 852002-51163_SCH5372311]
MQLVSISVCAWATGAAEIITATAIVNVATGIALKTRRFILLHTSAEILRPLLQTVALQK